MASPLFTFCPSSTNTFHTLPGMLVLAASQPSGTISSTIAGASVSSQIHQVLFFPTSAAQPQRCFWWSLNTRIILICSFRTPDIFQRLKLVSSIPIWIFHEENLLCLLKFPLHDRIKRIWSRIQKPRFSGLKVFCLFEWVPHLDGTSDKLITARALHTIDTQMSAANTNCIFRCPRSCRIVFHGTIHGVSDRLVLQPGTEIYISKSSTR